MSDLRHKATKTKMKFAHPLFNELLTYWKSRCKNDSIPSVNDFDLIDLPAALPDVTYWDMQPDQRIKCRMTGTKVVERMNVDITGMYLDEILSPDEAPQMLRALQTIQSSHCGLWFRAQNHHPNGRIVLMETFSLPLAGTQNALPKCVTLNNQLETIGYDQSDDADALIVGQEFQVREFVDLGWGTPETFE